MKMELKNMYIIQEENADLKEDLERLKSLTYEDRMRDVMDENKRIKERNGQLLFQVSELERTTEEL